MTAKFVKERPRVARKIVEIIDEATKMTNTDFDKYKRIIPKYTPMRAELRRFGNAPAVWLLLS